MALGSETILSGETRLLTMYLQAGAGTVTATSPTFSLFDRLGAPVTGLTGVAATADPTAAIVKVQYLLDTTGLTPGPYLALLKASALTSADNISQTREYDYDLWIRRTPDLP
jgi:hypothetical protein